MKYTKKQPTIIEAVQVRRDNLEEIKEFLGGEFSYAIPRTPDGVMRVKYDNITFKEFEYIVQFSPEAPLIAYGKELFEELYKKYDDV